MSISWANILKTTKPIKKKVIVKKQKIKLPELTIDEKRYNNFLENHETNILDLLFDLEQICENNPIHMLNNKKKGFYIDFINLIAECVILPQIEEEFYNSDDEEDEYINYEDY